MTSVVRTLVLVLAFASFTGLASAQESSAPADPSESARFQWGPLRFTPSLALSNMGVDTNVFNAADDPKRDTTAAVGPAANLWMHLGRARMTGKASGQYLYFKTYDNQRAWNTSDDLRFELPMSHLKPFIAGSYSNTRERPGYEIDSRSRAATNVATIGTDLKVSGRTAFQFSGSRMIIAFDQKETFLGAQLANALNRTTDTEQLQFRYVLTPLTTFVVKNDAIQDRFETDRTRNADSIRIMPGFEFKPLALISGSVYVGFRHFNALNDSLPDFNGVVATVDAKYKLPSTQVQIQVGRDLVFSYDLANPYYALTDVEGSVTQRITKTWDVVGRVGQQLLDYRSVRSQQLATAARSDTAREYGLGVGYWLGGAVRLGVDVNYLVRRSEEFSRQYEGLRVGAAVSYGLSQ
jgi:Putative beta-barrel porin 2